jgi:hypothetical protein
LSKQWLASAHTSAAIRLLRQVRQNYLGAIVVPEKNIIKNKTCVNLYIFGGTHRAHSRNLHSKVKLEDKIAEALKANRESDPYEALEQPRDLRRYRAIPTIENFGATPAVKRVLPAMPPAKKTVNKAHLAFTMTSEVSHCQEVRTK